MQLLEDLGRALRQQSLVLIDAPGVLYQGVGDDRLLLQGAMGEDGWDAGGSLDLPHHHLPGDPFENEPGGEMGGTAGVSDVVGTLYSAGDASFDIEEVVYAVITCGAVGAWIVPPTFCNHPVAARSCGVQFQSPPMIQGPTRPRIVKAMESSISRLHWAVIPPLPTML